MISFESWTICCKSLIVLYIQIFTNNVILFKKMVSKFDDCHFERFPPIIMETHQI